nr:DUF4174 domain-containing protein [Roseovarius aestuariivivens]
MTRAFFICFLMLAGVTASAQSGTEQDGFSEPQIIIPGEATDLSEFLWIKRPLVVFAESPADPRYVQQIDFLAERLDDLAERDVVVLTDTSPDKAGPLRKKLRPRGFMIALIGKDGQIYLRKPLPWSVREITRAIDKLPMRQQEIRDRRGPS